MDELDASCTYLFDAGPSPGARCSPGGWASIRRCCRRFTGRRCSGRGDVRGRGGNRPSLGNAGRRRDERLRCDAARIGRLGRRRGSDITGTSTLITVYAPAPASDDRDQHAHRRRRVGGLHDPRRRRRRDALGAARLHRNEASYEEIAAMAAAAPPGADWLLFLPYLNGERLGGAANARGDFLWPY